ncbi:hypothetical protein R1flu_000533 [Riccia fluitans]|uniref:argininosuccinate synthase n=1 Tax=Riccia fluitans TaxID=41844 RepID=A0ABD1Y0X1_9MARC
MLHAYRVVNERTMVAKFSASQLMLAKVTSKLMVSTIRPEQAGREVGADAVAHGEGNDQVRFESTFFALDPNLNIVGPWREWDIRGREDAIDYAKKRNVPGPVTKKSIHSRDRNLWHLSHEGDILEDLTNEPTEDMFKLTKDPREAPDTPESC